MTISPNPFQNRSQLNFKDDIASKAYLKLTTAKGMVVKEVEVELGGQNVAIDLLIDFTFCT